MDYSYLEMVYLLLLIRMGRTHALEESAGGCPSFWIIEITSEKGELENYASFEKWTKVPVIFGFSLCGYYVYVHGFQPCSWVPSTLGPICVLRKSVVLPTKFSYLDLPLPLEIISRISRLGFSISDKTGIRLHLTCYLFFIPYPNSIHFIYLPKGYGDSLGHVRIRCVVTSSEASYSRNTGV